MFHRKKAEIKLWIILFVAIACIFSIAINIKEESLAHKKITIDKIILKDDSTILRHACILENNGSIVWKGDATVLFKDIAGNTNWAEIETEGGSLFGRWAISSTRMTCYINKEIVVVTNQKLQPPF